MIRSTTQTDRAVTGAGAGARSARRTQPRDGVRRASLALSTSDAMPSAPPLSDARQTVPSASAILAPRSHSFPADPRQVGSARRFLMDLLTGSPIADDAVLFRPEVATNSIAHSNSRAPGGQFTVRAEASLDGRVRVEVRDQGGPWIARQKAHGQPLRGLGVVGRLSRDWDIWADGSRSRTVWFEIAPARA